LEKAMVTVLEDWSEAWKYRNQQVAHDNYKQILKTKVNEKKILYLYSNQEHIDEINKQFMLKTIDEHKMLMETSIQNWLHIHFDTFTKQIETKQPSNTWSKFNQNPDIEYRQDKNQKGWTNVPCKATEALHLSPLT
jgi:homospermidine synthase